MLAQGSKSGRGLPQSKTQATFGVGGVFQQAPRAHFPAILLAGLLAAGAASGQDQAPAATPAQLQERLAACISQPRFAAALWGVKIVSLDTGKTLFEHNAGKLLSPASNSKLYTVALALDRLGPDCRIRTSLFANAKPDSTGTLPGDLIVYGRGDPTLNARFHGNDIFNALAPLAAALTNAGVRRITGDLVGDASYLRGPEFGSGWAWDDQEYGYGAELSALTINDNVLEAALRPGERDGVPCRLTLSAAAAGFLAISNRTETVPKGGRRSLSFYRLPGQNVVYVSGQVPLEDPASTEELTVHNPAALFVALFREALARHGIALEGKLRTVDWLDRQASPMNSSAMVELGAVESPPLRDLAREVLKPSQNLYADLLLDCVGERQRAADTPPGRTSEELGIRELNQFLARAGIKRGEVFLEEGSGLSRDNLATPNATVTLLQFMSRHPCAQTFLQALPVAGVDGTLKNRMKNTPAAGNVRAKTGSLRWAHSLSGYATSAAGERFAFCLMLNRYHAPDPNHPPRADLDAVAVMLAGLTGRAE